MVPVGLLWLPQREANFDAAESSRYAVEWDGRLSFTRIALSRCDFGIRGYKYQIAIAIGRVGQFRRVGDLRGTCVSR